MKIITLLLLLLSYSSFAQQKDEPVYIYLDSVKYEAKKVFFDINNAEDVRMEKIAEDSVYTTHRYKSIYVKRKKKSPLASIKEMEVNLRKNNNIPDNEKIQVVIDGVILPTTQDCFIEQDYIKKIHILISDPKTKGDHLYRSPTIIIETKKNPK
nr:hypothetical protein [uncultured Flavobacterium sp.]